MNESAPPPTASAASAMPSFATEHEAEVA
jgi:hypothetical protein